MNFEIKVDLKPCPFCSGEAEMVVWPYSKTKNQYMPRCKDHSCCGRSDKRWTDLHTAVYAWNRRPRILRKVETCFYDKEEIYENCTVQVLTNTGTGDVSVGWWKNE